MKYWVITFLSVRILLGQTETRSAEIEKAREEKAKTLKPEVVSPAENRLLVLKDEKLLERISAGFNGWRAKIGNMVVGGGFALGPEYHREDLWKGRLTLRTAAQVSTRGFYKLDNQWTLPKLLNGKAYADFYTVHRNYNGINYYGPGPDSTKGGRSQYRLEDTSTEATGAVVPLKGLKLGGTIGHTWMNIGPTRNREVISSDRIFTERQAPGIQQQTNFLRYALFAQHDTRDNPGGPKEGHNVLFQYTWFDDDQLKRFNFRRIDAEVQKMVPLFNRTRVLAFRAKTALTDGDGNQVAPFYLQPVLGGSEDLRGFRPFRFSDRNMFVMNGEYRWEIFSGLDGAVFADAGKVFARRGQLNFSNLESSVGFGLRFNARNTTSIRMDVAFSHEGFQIWFKFSDVFAQRPFGAALTQPVF